jgi:NhaP-type Na+/H+ or K+/H+ antiporter
LRLPFRKVNLQEQFIMAYGGLRGAVGFSLVEMINPDIIPPKQMFVTTTLAVVVFTVFFQVPPNWIMSTFYKVMSLTSI